MKHLSPEQTAAFLAEYLNLCNKYGVIIDSCGCCNSPWIEALDGCRLLRIHIDDFDSICYEKETPDEAAERILGGS